MCSSGTPIKLHQSRPGSSITVMPELLDRDGRLGSDEDVCCPALTAFSSTFVCLTGFVERFTLFTIAVSGLGENRRVKNLGDNRNILSEWN